MCIRLTVLYDNNSDRDELQPAWGFSCLVEGAGPTILFDTGGHGPTFLANMAELGVSPSGVKIVVLSHAHWDHTGGLADFLRINNDVEVYMLESFPDKLKEMSRKAGARVVAIRDPAVICPGARTTGHMARAKGPAEQALVLSVGRGVTVLAGCAHPGVVEIVERAGEMSGETVDTVLGGFHLYRDGAETVRRVALRLKELGVRRVAPCHCSGDEAMRIFSEEFGDRYMNCEAGKVFEL